MPEILLALCGTSPAVVTETVWALANRREPSIPDRVVVLTTTVGREAVRQLLFENGGWRRLKTVLGTPANKLKFGMTGDSVRVFPDAAGTCDLKDIESVSDGAAVGDFILATLREFTETPGTRVTLSIAGGRKSMSALGALAMSMLGRPGDALCHVLINSPYDNPQLSPPFLFPEGYVRRLPDGGEHADGDAAICLHEIPFVRCREIFRREYGRLPGTFAETVALGNARLEPPSLRLDPGTLSCRVDDAPLALSHNEFIFYWMLADRCLDGCALLDNAYAAVLAIRSFIDRNGSAFPYLGSELCRALEAVFGTDPLGGVDAEQAAALRRMANRIKGKLLELTLTGAVEPLIPARPGRCGYGLEMAGDRIHIVE